MKVRNIRWLGVPTGNYVAMVGFLRDVMRLRCIFQESTTAEFATSEGDQIQVMAPGDPYYAFFVEHAVGPVPLFEVDDVHQARADSSRPGSSSWDRPDVTASGSGSTSGLRTATSTRPRADCARGEHGREPLIAQPPAADRATTSR